MDAKLFVKIAKALADPTRHEILRALRAKDKAKEAMTCSDACDSFELSQPTISHHVTQLKKAGLIEVEKHGSFHILRVNQALLDEFAAEVAGKSPVVKKTSRRVV